MILRDRDANTTGGWAAEADDTLEERRYYAQNWRHDVVAIVTAAGVMAEQVRYSAYGVPFGLPQGDVDGADNAYVTGNWNTTLGWDALSEDPDDGLGNRKGYAGYEHDPTLAPSWTLYHVRHRVYNADLGRWTRRDPLGYVDGMSLYEYGRTAPTSASDPTGLITIRQCVEQLKLCKKMDPMILLLKGQLSGDASCAMKGIFCKQNSDENGRGGDCGTRHADGRRKGGYACCENRQVFLCADNIPSINDVCRIIRHELVHILDLCRTKRACTGTDNLCGYPATCEIRACTEIRAYSMDGGCCDGKNLDEDCVKEGAKWSTTGGDCNAGHVDAVYNDCKLTVNPCGNRDCYQDNPWPSNIEPPDIE